MKRHASHAAVKVFVAAALVVFASLPSAAQPKSELKPPPPLDPAEGRRQARKLLGDLLQIRPTENITETLLFKIRSSDDKQTEVAVRFEIICTLTNFLSTYETLGSGDSNKSVKLTIAHNGNQPNEYWLSQPPCALPKRLDEQEIWLPFAGSDFSAADLGLEFLHWPDQRVIRNQMRRYVFCHMLESVNPHPAPGAYAKVTSWIGANRPEELVLVRAEARDARGKLLKVFEPTKLEKVNGVQELEEMRIWNRQTGTSTKVEFKFDNRKEAR